MVALAFTMSPRGAQLLNALRITLGQVNDLARFAPADADLIVQALVAHLRSWRPLAAIALPAPLETAPAGPIELVATPADGMSVPLSPTAFYELGAVAGGLSLYVHDDAGHDANQLLTFDQAGRFVADFHRVLARLAEAAR